MLRLMTTTAVVVAGLFAASAALAQTGQPNAASASAPQTAPGETLSQQDKQFVTEAAEGGMTEVELSKIAEKSSSPEVKHFAERMVRDHSTANAELTSIATGLEIEMPKTLAPLAPKDPRSAEEHARQGLRPALYAPDGRRP